MSLGLGSVIASLSQSLPWLPSISRHKGMVFLAVGALLAVNYWLAIARPRRMKCAPGDMCHVDSPAMRATRAVFWASVGVYVVAAVVTYGGLWWVRTQS